MNKVILMGRLTSDPEVRYGTGEKNMAVGRYTLAVDRRYKRDGEQQADFIRCVAFDKAAEFAEKYFRKGMRVCVSGRVQTGSYTDREGRKVHTTDVIIEDQEFAESKKEAGQQAQGQQPQPQPEQLGDGFMSIPDGVDDDSLPFN